MKPHTTDMTLVVDRSGSMQQRRKDAEGGVNAFIRENFLEVISYAVPTLSMAKLATPPARMSMAPASDGCSSGARAVSAVSECQTLPLHSDPES
jgi:hypothetical protein